MEKALKKLLFIDFILECHHSIEKLDGLYGQLGFMDETDAVAEIRDHMSLYNSKTAMLGKTPLPNP